MKTKIFFTILLSSIILFIGIIGVEVLQSRNPSEIFSLKKVSAAPDKYYRFSYTCQCNYTPPVGCEGQGTDATCDAPSGRVTCTSGFSCVFIFWYTCNGMTQHSCSQPS